MAASYEDAAVGWEIYRNSGFNLDMAGINERLLAVQRTPIAERTFTHYNRLRRRGFRRYISTNRLDTMNVPDPFLDESIRSRYAFTAANVPAQIVLHRQDIEVSIAGNADAISDFGAEVVVADVEQMMALRQSVPAHGTPVTVNFLRPAHTSYGTIDFVSLVDQQSVRIGVVFRELTPVQELVGSLSLAARTVEFQIGMGQGTPGLDTVSQDVYWLLQSVEASRSIVNALLEGMSSTSLYSPTPAVERMSVASPLDTWLKISIQVYLVMDSAIAKVAGTAANVKKLGDIVGGAAQKTADAKLVDGQAEVQYAYADYIRAKTAGQLQTNRREEIANEVMTEAAEYVLAGIRAAGQAIKAPDFNVERISKLILDDLIPSLEHLTPRGITMGIPAQPAPADGVGGDGQLEV